MIGHFVRWGRGPMINCRNEFQITQGRQAGGPASAQSAKFTLSINLKTAKTLGLTVPNTLLAVADEVIE
jgi:putative ABC transport system substrate-binding protein